MPAPGSLRQRGGAAPPASRGGEGAADEVAPAGAGLGRTAAIAVAVEEVLGRLAEASGSDGRRVCVSFGVIASV